MLRSEAVQIVELLSISHQEVHSSCDMAILFRHHHDMYLCANLLNLRQLPYQVRDKSGQFDPAADTIKVLTLHAGKGLESSVVAMVGVEHMLAQGEDERDEARLFYVGAARVTLQGMVVLVGLALMLMLMTFPAARQIGCASSGKARCKLPIPTQANDQPLRDPGRSHIKQPGLVALVFALR